MKKYKLKVVLGKRQYRNGPSESAMKKHFAEKSGHGQLKSKKARPPKVTAAGKRLKKIAQGLGS